MREDGRWGTIMQRDFMAGDIPWNGTREVTDASKSM